MRKSAIFLANYWKLWNKKYKKWQRTTSGLAQVADTAAGHRSENLKSRRKNNKSAKCKKQ